VAYRLLEPEEIENKKILVVGGGDSAVESAMLLADQNEVILSYRKDGFQRIKAKNQERINEYIDSNKIKMLFNSNLTKIEMDKVSINFNDGKVDEFPNLYFCRRRITNSVPTKDWIKYHKKTW